MRTKKRARLATWAPPIDKAEADALAALTQVRHARVALLRNPAALAELKATIKTMSRGAARVLRKMLADDLKLMRLLDRQALHQRRVERFEDAIATEMADALAAAGRPA